MNLDYDDVLHLYKGWRRSESALKDKNKELSALKLRTKQLQESHSKFRGQIHALESVKELTTALQLQLSTLQQENQRLESVNLNLVDEIKSKDDIINEKNAIEEQQSRLLHNIQLDFAAVNSRYEETTKFQKELENLLSEEQKMRRAADTRFAYMEESNISLKEENRQLKHKLDNANKKLSQCDEELAHASEQLSTLSKELTSINVNETQLSSLRAENEVLRGDISRLLRLIEYFPGNRELFDMWNDSGGMVYVGRDDKREGEFGTDLRNSQSLTQGAIFELGEAIDESINNTTNGLAFGKSSITPTEFAHLKRIHGGDPFPLSANMTVSVT